MPDLVIYSNLKDGAFTALKMEAKFKISMSKGTIFQQKLKVYKESLFCQK